MTASLRSRGSAGMGGRWHPARGQAHDVADVVGDRQVGVSGLDRLRAAGTGGRAAERPCLRPCPRGAASARPWPTRSPSSARRTSWTMWTRFRSTPSTWSVKVSDVTLVALAQVVQVRLGGVERATGGTVVLVDAEVAEEGIRVVSDRQQVARLAHVAVVVAPGSRDGRLVQSKRRVDRGGVVPPGVGFTPSRGVVSERWWLSVIVRLLVARSSGDSSTAGARRSRSTAAASRRRSSTTTGT